ncbi:MAG: hypothetical protein O3A36_02735 [bacterium]|nr:hypothetical protein [bacterium]
MHASTQHSKAELMEQATQLIAETDVFLKKSQKDYDAMEKTITIQKNESEEAHKVLDDTIREQLTKVTKAADEYFESLDETEN